MRAGPESCLGLQGSLGWVLTAEQESAWRGSQKSFLLRALEAGKGKSRNWEEFSVEKRRLLGEIMGW